MNTVKLTPMHSLEVWLCPSTLVQLYKLLSRNRELVIFIFALALKVHLVEWLKMMVGNRRAEEVVDPDMEAKPATRALKRALLVALRCVDPDSDKRPTMGHVVRMLEAEDVPSREVVVFHFFYLCLVVCIITEKQLVLPLGPRLN